MRGEMNETCSQDFLQERLIVSNRLCEIFLEITSIDECLLRPKKQRDNLNVEVVL
jgi:hypothetical protein